MALAISREAPAPSSLAGTDTEAAAASVAALASDLAALAVAAADAAGAVDAAAEPLSEATVSHPASGSARRSPSPGGGWCGRWRSPC